MKTQHLVILAITGLGLLTAPAFGQEKVKESAASIAQRSCSLCHGPGGITSSELFPQLAGQPAPYLVNQLTAFKEQTRSDLNARRFMWGIASRLSDEDIKNLANYFSAQTPVLPVKVADTAAYERGKKIFTTGIPAKNVPACMDCHGERGEGNDTTPRLGGQHEAYLIRQLNVFYNKRQRPDATAMHEVVKGLTKDDINAIAYYLQAQ